MLSSIEIWDYEPSSKILLTLFNGVCLTLSRTRSLYKISIQSVSDLKTKINSKPSLRTKHTKTDGKLINYFLSCYWRLQCAYVIKKNAKNRLVSNSYIPRHVKQVSLLDLSEEELNSWYFFLFNFRRRFLQECLLIWGKPSCCIEFLIDSDDWNLDRKSCSSKTLIKIFFSLSFDKCATIFPFDNRAQACAVIPWFLVLLLLLINRSLEHGMDDCKVASFRKYFGVSKSKTNFSREKNHGDYSNSNIKKPKIVVTELNQLFI